jgi:hypothetical protein
VVGDLVSRVLDIDARAEKLRAEAVRVAEAIHHETVEKTGRARKELEDRIARAIAEIQVRAKEESRKKLAEVEAQGKLDVAAAGSVGEAVLSRAVEKVVLRARGRG